MIEFQPHYEEKLRVLDRHVDAQGKTTLNISEHMKFRREQSAIALKKKMIKEAAKKEKLMITKTKAKD